MNAPFDIYLVVYSYFDLVEFTVRHRSWSFILKNLETLFLDDTPSLSHFVNEPPHGKTNNVVSEQVRHKPVCAVKEAG